MAGASGAPLQVACSWSLIWGWVVVGRPFLSVSRLHLFFCFEGCELFMFFFGRLPPLVMFFLS
jgi:hypothetical protein